MRSFNNFRPSLTFFALTAVLGLLALPIDNRRFTTEVQARRFPSIETTNAAAIVAPATYNVASAFSAINNPNGVWNYGWSSTLGSTFNPGIAFVRSGLKGWAGGIAPDKNPSVLHNGNTFPVSLANNLSIPAGALVMHPGPNDEKQIVRWTAPSSGTYTIKATFTRMHTGGTDVHILLNGSSIFSGAVIAQSQLASFSSALANVNTGDTIDFVVGFGGDRNYFSDSTRVQAVITSIVASPSTCIQLCQKDQFDCIKKSHSLAERAKCIETGDECRKECP